jgi:hypothetical protein
MVVKVTVDSTEYTLGVVEGLDIDVRYEGGAEPIYGSRIRRHSAGSKHATFTITRWFYSDAKQEALILDLFLNESIFTLEGSLQDNSGNPITNTSIKLTGCRLYRYRPRTGRADDIIGEEGSGEATDWTMNVANTQ